MFLLCPGVLFSLAGASPTLWSYDDELDNDIAKRSMPQVHYIFFPPALIFIKKDLRLIGSKSYLSLWLSVQPNYLTVQAVWKSPCQHARSCLWKLWRPRFVHISPQNFAFSMCSGMAAFLDESFDPFAFVNSRRRKRGGAVEEWATSIQRFYC